MSIFSKLNLTSFFGLNEDEEYEENEVEEQQAMNGYSKQPAATSQGAYTRPAPAATRPTAVRPAATRPTKERFKKTSEPAHRNYNEQKREASKVVTFNSGAAQRTREDQQEGSIPKPERKKAAAVGRGKIIVMEPRVYSEAMNIAKCIIREEAVIVNFRLVEEYQARRIVDFLTGTVYALDGDIQRVGDEIFLCTPQNMEIDGTTAKDIFGEGSQFFDY